MKRAEKRRRNGFTLIELLVVMGLMALLSAMVFSNSFGMSQSAAYSAAQDVVYNVLQMARQRACIDGKDVYVIIDAKQRSLSIIEGTGLISDAYQSAVRPNKDDEDKSEGFFVDNGYSLQRPDKAETDIYNLKSGAQAKLAAVLDEKRNDDIPLISTGRNRREKSQEQRFEYTIRQVWLAPCEGKGKPVASDWAVGSTYGLSILPPQHLPKGFDIEMEKGDTVCFYSDGSSGVATFKGGQDLVKNNHQARVVVTPSVKFKAGKEDKSIRFTVSGGLVAVDSAIRAPGK